AGGAGRRAHPGREAAAQGRGDLEAARRSEGRRRGGRGGRDDGLDPAAGPGDGFRASGDGVGRQRVRGAATAAWSVAVAALCLSPGCRRAKLPPRPDGAAVVVVTGGEPEPP